MRILTFDIEDWFHILDLPLVEDPATWDGYESRIEAGLQRILDLLEQEGTSATFFVLGWIAERYPHLVRRIAERGFEIGSHSYHHSLIYKMDPESFRRDLLRSTAVLSDLTGQAVRLYRAPGFSVTPACAWALEVMVESGIEVDCSLFAAPRRHGGFEELKASEPFRVDVGGSLLKELPMSFVEVLGKPVVYSGGGYFRLIPSFITQSLAQRQEYVMTYFHPRDFDPKQPRLPMGAFRKWQTYVGLSKARDKLQSLIRTVPFTDIKQAETQIDWDTTPIFSATPYLS